MFGLGTVLFFGVTGITLNHPDWAFGGSEVVVQAKGHVDLRIGSSPEARHGRVR